MPDKKKRAKTHVGWEVRALDVGQYIWGLDNDEMKESRAAKIGLRQVKE